MVGAVGLVEFAASLALRQVFAGEHDGEDAGGHRRIGRIGRMNPHRAIEIVDFEQDAFALGFEDRAIMLAVRIVIGIKGVEAAHPFKNALRLAKGMASTPLVIITVPPMKVVRS